MEQSIHCQNLLELKGDRLLRIGFIQTSRDHRGFTLMEACNYAQEECPIVDGLLLTLLDS